ncbi:MAG: formylglycine-generating enzyme family protein, partial [Bacteriovoracaceae bacterium]|nr:formylglycine-generating enzyme family protein [Bacteriovoracaceae bacterium]
MLHEKVSPFLCLICFLLALPVAYADVALIGPHGRVVLFYNNALPELGPWRKEVYGPHLQLDRKGQLALRKDPVWVLQEEDPTPREEVVVRFYEDLCILPDDENATRDDIDCNLQPDNPDRHILSPAFRAQLGTAFKVVGDQGYYPDEALADREIYKNRQMTAEEIETNIIDILSSAKDLVERQEAFGNRYADDILESDDVEPPQKAVQEYANEKLIQETTLPEVTKRFRATIDDLYKKINDRKIHILLLRHSKKDFQAALLNAFLLLPNIDDKFVPIKAGKFMMGSNFDAYGHYKNEHLVNVTITHDFEMMATEVTQGEWYMVMGENPSPFNKEEYCPDQYLKIGNVELCLNLPVTNVSYDEIQTFIRRVAASNSNYRYRLPTEAEWEYAASEGGKAWGQDPKDLNANWRIFAHTAEGKSFLRKLNYRFPPFSAGNYVWHSGNSNGQPHQIATKSPNAWGLYDMFGNVAEFTDSDYRPKALGGEDPNYRFVEDTSMKAKALGFAKNVFLKKTGKTEDEEEAYYGKAIRGESFIDSFAEPPRPEESKANNTI